MLILRWLQKQDFSNCQCTCYNPLIARESGHCQQWSFDFTVYTYVMCTNSHVIRHVETHVRLQQLVLCCCWARSWWRLHRSRVVILHVKSTLVVKTQHWHQRDTEMNPDILEYTIRTVRYHTAWYRSKIQMLRVVLRFLFIRAQPQH
jgi:hypothetical protein